MRWALSLLVLVLALIIRWEYQSSSSISHDDVISVITAQGNVSAYDQTLVSKTDRWIPASEWKTYLKKTSDASWHTIAADLANNDIHPPLYFWLLRWWLRWFGPD